MNRWLLAICALIVSLAIVVSCKQLYTTSLGSGLARNSIAISENASISDLLSLSLSSTGSDSEGAKAILDALGNKSQTDISNLSVADQTTILNLATTATVDMSTLTTLASDATKPGANTDGLIAKAFGTFDSTANLTAIVTILSNPETVKTAPVESIALASAVVLADVASDIGTDKLMTIMSQDNPDLSAYTPDQQAKIKLITGVVDILDTRPASDTANVTMGDFKLTDLLKGNKK